MTSNVIAVVFALAYYAVTIWLCRGIRLDVRSLSFAAVIIALTLVLSSIMIPLPTGAAITAGSWIPLMVLALVYDFRLAFIAGWICGGLALFMVPAWQPVHWGQVFVEHFVCFSCLGYAGVFGNEKRWQMLLGIVTAVVIKFLGHVISGVIFFSNNAWDGWGAWAYSLAYHVSSKIPEGIITAIIVMLLPLAAIRKLVSGRRS